MITSLLEILELPKFGRMTTLQYNLSHVIRIFWGRYGQKLLRHNLYLKIPFFKEGLEYPILLSTEYAIGDNIQLKTRFLYKSIKQSSS